jgi:hypothetical protein
MMPSSSEIWLEIRDVERLQIANEGSRADCLGLANRGRGDQGDVGRKYDGDALVVEVGILEGTTGQSAWDSIYEESLTFLGL